MFILAHRVKMNRKLIFKSSRFVPFGANLIKFGAKPDIPDKLASLTTTVDGEELELLADCFM